MKKEYEILFTPFKIGNVEIKNRFVLAPMGQTSLIDTLHGKGFKAENKDFFVDKAKDGVGLIIPGVTFLYSFLDHSPVWERKEYFEQLQDVADEIHKYGSKIFIQLSAGMGKAFPLSNEMVENFEVFKEKGHLDLTAVLEMDSLIDGSMNLKHKL